MLGVGIDLVRVSRIVESIETFGERFLRRVFTEGELAYAGAHPERLAARFAAKEAAKKALDLDGVGWRDIEVIGTGGKPRLALHGAAARDCEIAISLSHEGDFATAIVVTTGKTA